MTLKEIEDIEATPKEEESEVESSNDEETLVADPVTGELLVVWRALHAKLKTSDDQRENIFQSICSIKGRVCSWIIDSGSCTNVAATTLVEKLNISTTPHPSPYKLQWLSDGNQLKVSQQVLRPSISELQSFAVWVFDFLGKYLWNRNRIALKVRVSVIIPE
ncbi:hypothetical protein CFOL_v3_28587 [Cephalotus follicularis]|uniref:Asp_protease_2 domain-containing protein n=1 Tax=Cephalotus follicularis TaxID=3775 RepID=A0A1Q3CY54_CEPFO|nr:hypothetical protein CFOL_v3_28587 [Cephalotus follicularis]